MTTKNAAELRKRLGALGYTTASQAAAALQLDGAGVWRAWKGQRPVSPATWALVEELEAAQPAPMSQRARQLLSGAMAPLPGALVPTPIPRNNIERGIDWRSVYAECEATGLIVREHRSNGSGRPVLTELGVRAVKFLHARQAA